MINSKFGAFVISILCFGFIFGGCAKTVVPLPNVGNQITVTITLRGDIDTVNNKYYMIFGSANPAIPYIDKPSYFFAPGENYDSLKMNVSKDLNYYYTYYFTTWNDYILLKNDFYTVINGPFILANHVTYTGSYLDFRTAPGDPSLKKKIILTFNFNKLSTLPADLYFNFVCVDKDGYQRDYLRATDNKVSVNAGTTISDKLEPADPLIDPSLDIISWGMAVQNNSK
ncbi:MAG: hypothetical protein NTZ10_01075 [Candidatus Saganbacteria bacterium]|nr:hypothetical protein [Candidatus Saganbacteria bacterium]